LERELRSLYVLYPQIENMVLQRVGDFVIVATTADGCALLDADNRCRIEKEHDKSMKPSICNIFPFSVFRRIGKTVSVSPHFICPLRLVVPAKPGEVEGTHERLAASFREGEILTTDYIKINVPPIPLNPDLDAVRTVEREKAFRDLCASSFGRRNFRDTLKAASQDAPELERFAERAARLMRVTVPPRSKQYDELDDLLLAIAPVHRLSLLLMSGEGILRALLVAELVVRRAWSLAKLPLNLQGAMNLAFNFQPTERLLGQADEPLQRGIRSSKKDLTFQDPDLTFAAFLALRELSDGKGVMHTLEEVISDSMPASDRSALFQKLGTLLDTGPPTKRDKHKARP